MPAALPRRLLTRPISEIVTQGPSNGPALAATNGLPPAVNQSAAAAQVRFLRPPSPAALAHRRPRCPHPPDAQHDPYAAAAASYAPYSAVVNPAYAASYSPTTVTSLPSYYAPPAQQQQQQQQHGDQTPHEQHLHHDHSHLLDEHFPSSEIRYTQQIEQQHQQHQQHSQTQSRAHSPPTVSPPPPPTPVAGPSGTNGTTKRKEKPPAANGFGSGDESAPPPKRRRPAARAFKDGENEDDDVGPGGGAKHWSVEEKTRLFSWILEDDERWENFGSKMNVVFREVRP